MAANVKKELKIPERNVKRHYEPKDLGEFDDLASAISIDILLGFQTAKFSKILKSGMKLDIKLLNTILKNYRQDQNADFAVLTMLKCGPLRSFVLGKPLEWREGFYKHLIGYLKSFPEVDSGKCTLYLLSKSPMKLLRFQPFKCHKYFVSFQDFKLSNAGSEPKEERKSSQQKIGRPAKRFVAFLAQ